MRAAARRTWSRSPTYKQSFIDSYGECPKDDS